MLQLHKQLSVKCNEYNNNINNESAVQWRPLQLLARNGFYKTYHVPCTDRQMHCWYWVDQKLDKFRSQPTIQNSALV